MYIQSQSRNRLNLSADEYYCPLCRQLADVIVPILPTASDTPVIVVPPEQHVQCIKDIGAMLQQKPAIIRVCNCHLYHSQQVVFPLSDCDCIKKTIKGITTLVLCHSLYLYQTADI